VILFGGVMSKTEGWYGDTWSWDGYGWSEETPMTSPSARAHAAMAFDPALGSPVLFGGTHGDAYEIESFGDTWAWEGNDWTRLAAKSSIYRRSHFAAVGGRVWSDGSGQHSVPMLLFGGLRPYWNLDASPAEYEEGTSFAADLWVFNDPTAVPCGCHRYGGHDDT
jgi:hypothetical protein